MLTSISNFKSRINKDSTTDDDFIERLISQASDDIEKFTDRKLRGRTYGANGLDAEIRNGNGTNKLFAWEYPIIPVTSLYDDI